MGGGAVDGLFFFGRPRLVRDEVELGVCQISQARQKLGEEGLKGEGGGILLERRQYLAGDVSTRAGPTSPSFTRSVSWPYKALGDGWGEREQSVGEGAAPFQWACNGASWVPGAGMEMGTLLGATGKPKTCLATSEWTGGVGSGVVHTCMYVCTCTKRGHTSLYVLYLPIVLSS